MNYQLYLLMVVIVIIVLHIKEPNMEIQYVKLSSVGPIKSLPLMGLVVLYVPFNMNIQSN